MTALTHTSFYNITCKVCTVIRNVLITIFVGMVALGESAGRARAAAELSRQGYHVEAKRLMLRKDQEIV